MCYSAQVWQAYQKYVRAFGADIDLDAFLALYWRRREGDKIETAKGLDAAFSANDADERCRRIAAEVDAYDGARVTRLEQALFRQKQRLAAAERAWAAKQTRKASEERRIATAKIAWSIDKLARIRRTNLVDDDARIFPGWHVPVMLVEDGRRVVRPMRYQCRVPGKPASYDARFPGTYNARRDSLGGYWKTLFGQHHAVVVAQAFYEHVRRPDPDRPGEDGENAILQFRPQPAQDMLLACVYARWTAPGHPDLWSFAVITDEPPAEVAAAGHDRCPIPLRPGHLDDWLVPDPRHLERTQAILDDRERPYFEHRLAA
jgi:putative SOS response-associated peptidase YedK